MSLLQKLGFGKKSQSVVGVDVGTSSIKAVQIRRDGGKAILETYGTISLGPYAKLGVGQATNLGVEELARAIGDLFKEANVTTKRTALSIPLRSSLVKVIELPRVEQAQMNQMIPLEARKYIPVPISEVALDWWVIPNEKLSGVEDASVEDQGNNIANSQGKIEVLVVAIHNETISKFQDIAVKAGLTLGTFEVESFSSIRALLDRDISASAIIDIGASTTKLYIIDYGIIKVANTINRGSQELTSALAMSMGITFEQAEELKRRDGLISANRTVGISNSVGGDSTAVLSSTLELLFHEASRVLIDYQRRYSRLVSRVILVGGGAMLKGIIPIAKKKFEIEVGMGYPFRNVVAPEFLENVLKETGPEFSNAVGLAMRELSNL